MKIIITEQQVGLYSALRRRDEMWNIVQHSFPYMYPCDFSRDEIVEAVSGEIWDVIASDWMIYSHRKEYQELDIAEYVLSLCTQDYELQRVGAELLLFQERDAFDLLRYLKYFVDTMRKNNVVWGLGRGSSTASYVLYLLGVHKIDSLYYDLPIDEFLK